MTKESVRLIFVYRIEALTKPCDNKRHNSPHLLYAEWGCRILPTIHIQEMSVVRLSYRLENCQIFYSGLRKTLSICLQSEDCNANLEIISESCKIALKNSGY